MSHRSNPSACVQAVLATLTFGLAAARADPISDAHRLSANPDTPVMSFFWRNKTHATVGGIVPLLIPGETGGWLLQLSASVQLDNSILNPLPNNYWRGLLGVELGYRFALRPGLPASIALLVQHESDHETRFSTVNANTPFGFFDLNSVGLLFDLSFRPASQRVTVSALTRLHVATCTVSPTLCATEGQRWGSQTAEGLFEIVWDGPASKPVAGHWRPVVSFLADKVLPHGLVAEEHRFVAHAGVWVPTEHRGTFEFYALGWIGNEVGYLRSRRITEAGLGFRWSP
jgi:hypothetical protein